MAGRLAGWRPRLGRVLVALVGIVATLESVLVWIQPAEGDKGGFSTRRAWAHLLRAANWIKAMQARLAEEGRAERAARRAETERQGEGGKRGGRKRGPRKQPRKPAEKPEPDDCIMGRTDQEVMAQICADLAVVASMLEDDDAARRLAIYQREVQALLGGPPPALMAAAEAQRRMAARSSPASREWESAAPGAGAGSAAMAVHAPDSG